jgi:predicted alpha-1,2-mannosidase
MGGPEAMASMLDSVFQLPPVFDNSYYGQTIHEITEMVVANFGQYAHGNQPIQHMIYLYNYAGQPKKAAYWLREVMTRLYKPSPDGYCGDEDNGQTSAWYVFSALGFYPVCPGKPEYVLGAPLFKKVTIQMPNGKQCTINAPANGPDRRYVRQRTWNGKPLPGFILTHQALMQGGVMNCEMTN